MPDFLSDDLIYALGWTVLHSLWQAAIIAIGLGVAQYFLQERKAVARYNLSFTALLLVMSAACITFLIYFQNDGATSEAFVLFFNENISVEQGLLPQIGSTFSAYFETHLPLIVSVWMVGVLILVLRMLGALAFLERLKTRQNQPLSAYWQDKMQALVDKIPVKQQVQLLESTLIKVPMVIGNLKPIILLPIGAVNQLSVAQVEAILAHELAHIYRHDYLVNILQSIIETLFYFNPAVWFISASIRTERENCCDDIAVELCGNSLTYAKALVSLQELNHGAPRFAMAFSNKRNQLLNRVKRLLNQPQNKSNIMEKLIASSLVLVALLLFTAAKSVEEFEPMTQSISTQIDRDTIPTPPTPKSYKNSESKTTIRRKTDNQDVKLQMENGEIIGLHIDGKKINPKDYDKYQAIINEVKSTPPPPAPPMPPAPGTVPAPPAPPMPPNMQVIKKKGADGESQVYLIERDSDDNTTIVEVEDGGRLFINGEEISNIEEIGDLEAFEIAALDFEMPDMDDLDILAIQIDAMDKIDIESIIENIDIPELDEEARAELREQLQELEEEQEEHIMELRERMEDQKAEMKERKEELRKRMEERKIELKERQIELHEAMRDRNEEIREQHRELAKHHKEMQREIQSRVHEANEEMRERMREAGYEHRSITHESGLLAAIQSALIADGLVKEGEKYNFILDEKKMKINNSKMSQNVYDRYRNIVRAHKRNESGGDFEIRIKKSKSNSWVSSSFSD